MSKNSMRQRAVCRVTICRPAASAAVASRLGGHYEARPRTRRLPALRRRAVGALEESERSCGLHVDEPSNRPLGLLYGHTLTSSAPPRSNAIATASYPRPILTTFSRWCRRPAAAAHAGRRFRKVATMKIALLGTGFGQAHAAVYAQHAGVDEVIVFRTDTGETVEDQRPTRVRDHD
jgi:hypothetical protein